MNYIRPTRLEINLNVLKKNFDAINKYKNPNTKICAVVKANAYGCGIYEIAKASLEYGVEYIAVAILDEAIYLRNKGISAPILILGYTPINSLDIVVDLELTQTIFDMESAKELSRLSKEKDKISKIHIKIDSGMNRIGLKASDITVKQIVEIIKLNNIIVEGIYTHLSKVYDGDKEFTIKQINCFMDLLKQLENENINIQIKHILSSGGFLEYPEYQLDMVRLGCLIYGLYPPCSTKGKIANQSIFLFKTKVVLIKSVLAGKQISYSGVYTTKRDSIIATLPVGYCDGFPRRLSSKGKVLINNQFAPIVGNICMDMCMVDITDIDGVEVGTDVILIGKSDEKEITLLDINDIVESVRTEIISQVSMRVPRKYIK
ncbi:MAG: alanine racemase [Tissierellaceae bacterium]|nr:alanine racemase [Tissierellaceae bacterium]